MATVELKSISELFGLQFFVPSYQRGYRWTIVQVRELLEDLPGADAKYHASCMQTHLLFEYGKIGNESKDAAVPHGAFGYISHGAKALILLGSLDGNVEFTPYLHLWKIGSVVKT